MLPIEPVAKYSPPARHGRTPPRADAAHRPLATHTALSPEERTAVRHSLAVAWAVLALLVTGAMISVALSPGGPSMIAQLGL